MRCKTFFSQLVIALTRTSPAFAPDHRKVRDRYTAGGASRGRHRHDSDGGCRTSWRLRANSDRVVQQPQRTAPTLYDRQSPLTCANDPYRPACA